MKLILNELKSHLDQKVVSESIYNVEAIRLHIYKHNSPSGKLKVQVRNDNGLIAESTPVDISNISSSDFFHGMVRFDLNTQLNKNTEYTIRLISEDGYSFSESSYIGLCLDFDFNTYKKNPTPEYLLNNSYDYEVWVRK